MSFESIKTPVGAVQPPLPFSSATRAAGLVFVSGQASVENGKLINDAFENQVRRTIQNVEGVLKAAGLTLKDVCQVRAYVQDPKDLAQYNVVYRQFFSEPYPARTTLTGCLPAEALKFEMEVVAVDTRK